MQDYPAANSFKWLMHGAPYTEWEETNVNGRRQIKIKGRDEYLKPKCHVNTWQWGVIAGANYLPYYNVEVYLTQCPSDRNKVEVVARNKYGSLSYMATYGKWTYFGTNSYFMSSIHRRECFNKN